ncbi:hypothetical protein ES703_61014 [subsurface metagenome]
MFNWFGQREGKGKQKARQLWEREFNITKEGLDEEQVVVFVNNLIAQHKASQQASAASLRSLLKTAVTDAEQIAASIKMKARAKGEAEATTIIAQAKQEGQEIKRKAEIATQKEAEDTLASANRKAEITELEATQKALLFLLRAREDIEKEIREEYKNTYDQLFSSLQKLMSEGQNIEMELKSKRARLWESKEFELERYEAALLETSEAAVPPPETAAPMETEIETDIAGKERMEQPAQPQEETLVEEAEQPAQPQAEALAEEAAIPEPAEEITEELLKEHFPEEMPGREEPGSVQLKQDSQTLYGGEVELAIAMPVELKLVSKFYNHLQTIPEIKIRHTKGSWDRGTTITVVLDKPIPLISVISKIPGVKATPELPQKDSLAKGTSSSLLRGGGKGVKRIKLTLREA